MYPDIYQAMAMRIDQFTFGSIRIDGVTYEHDLHFFLRRVTLNRLLFGTPAEHRRWLAAMQIKQERAA